MPRIFIQHGTKKYTGPTIRSILDENRWMGIVFDKKELAGILRFAGAVGGELWKTVFLPMRFDMDYAKRLGYGVDKGYNTWKAANVGKTVSYGGRAGDFKTRQTFVMAGPQPAPYVASGGSKEACLASARVQVTASSSKVVIKIKFMLGNIAFKKADSFTNLPAWEYARVVQEVDRVLRVRIAQELENKGSIDTRITSFKTRGTIDSDLKARYAPFMSERKAI